MVAANLPKTIGGYNFIKLIGRGGLAEVILRIFPHINRQLSPPCGAVINIC